MAKLVEAQPKPLRPEDFVQSGHIIWGKAENEETPVLTKELLDKSESTPLIGYFGKAELSIAGQTSLFSPQPQKTKQAQRSLSIKIEPTQAQLSIASSQQDESNSPSKIGQKHLEEGRHKLHTLKNTVRRIKKTLKDDPELIALQNFSVNLKKEDPSILNPLLIGSVGIILLLLFRFYL